MVVGYSQQRIDLVSAFPSSEAGRFIGRSVDVMLRVSRGVRCTYQEHSNDDARVQPDKNSYRGVVLQIEDADVLKVYSDFALPAGVSGDPRARSISVSAQSRLSPVEGFHVDTKSPTW
jgi:hypothetical protein